MKYLTLVPLLLLTGCGTFTNEHVQTIQAVLQDQVSNGNMTQAQFEAVMNALSGIAEGDWPRILLDIGETLLTLVLGYFGIRYWRGSPTARKGLAPVAKTP